MVAVAALISLPLCKILFGGEKNSPFQVEPINTLKK
jgi:hypothetical protein